MPKNDDFFGDEFDMDRNGKTDTSEEWLAQQAYSHVAGFDKDGSRTVRRPAPAARPGEESWIRQRIAGGVVRLLFAALLLVLSVLIFLYGKSSFVFLGLLTTLFGLWLLLRGTLLLREVRRARK